MIITFVNRRNKIYVFHGFYGGESRGDADTHRHV